MKTLLVLLLSAFVVVSASLDYPANTAQWILSNGYPAEVHDITTEDGYILTIFRIPYGRNDVISSNRPPVIVQHGLLVDSDCWVIATPEKGLPYILADAGYDVWIGNNRGTTYGLKHVNLTQYDQQFWNFSFDEMGNYDVPAMIDFIVSLTGYKKVAYIGHSQGTTQFFAMGALRPEYNEKVSVFAALAPVAFLNGTEGAIHALSRFTTEFATIMKLLHIYHLLGHDYLTSAIYEYICRPDGWLVDICDNVIEFIVGFDKPQINQTLIDIAVRTIPAGASLKQLIHYGQLCENGGTFKRYDYGSRKNLEIYQYTDPPEYDLDKITAPVILYYAENDYLARLPNVLEISRKLGSQIIKKVKINRSEFNHIDFMWAKDVDTLLYKDLVKNIKNVP